MDAIDFSRGASSGAEGLEGLRAFGVFGSSGVPGPSQDVAERLAAKCLGLGLDAENVEGEDESLEPVARSVSGATDDGRQGGGHALVDEGALIREAVRQQFAQLAKQVEDLNSQLSTAQSAISALTADLESMAERASAAESQIREYEVAANKARILAEGHADAAKGLVRSIQKDKASALSVPLPMKPPVAEAVTGRDEEFLRRLEDTVRDGYACQRRLQATIETAEAVRPWEPEPRRAPSVQSWGGSVSAPATPRRTSSPTGDWEDEPDPSAPAWRLSESAGGEESWEEETRPRAMAPVMETEVWEDEPDPSIAPPESSVVDFNPDPEEWEDEPEIR